MLLRRRSRPESGDRREVRHAHDRDAERRAIEEGLGKVRRGSLRPYRRLSFLRALSWQVGLQSLTGSTGGGCNVRLLTSERQIAGPAISGQLPLPVTLTRKHPEILATLFASLTRGRGHQSFAAASFVCHVANHVHACGFNFNLS